MKKTLGLILKLLAIIAGIAFIGMGFFLFYLISDKDGPYTETPFITGTLVLIGIFLILIWRLSKDVTLSNFLDSGAIFSISIAGYYAFTPVVTGSNLFLMQINSGNIFTFFSNESYKLFKTSKDFVTFKSVYYQHVALIIGLLILAVVLFVISYKRKCNHQTVGDSRIK